jgi:predicted SnoaL-like aldol condensation-catalyzing enzyme
MRNRRYCQSRRQAEVSRQAEVNGRKESVKKLFLSLAVSLMTTPLYAQIPPEPARDQPTLLKAANKQLEANKRLVYDFWREVFEAGHMDLADKYMAETYIQHNPNVPTGRKAFVDFFSKRFASGPQPVKPTVQQPLIAILADGDFVSMVFVREYTNPKDNTKYKSTWWDMFRLENGKIAEHWDPATKN